jgi:hypothetical protein
MMDNARPPGPPVALRRRYSGAPRGRRITDPLSQTEQRDVLAVGKTANNRECRVVMTETTRRSLRRSKTSDDGADSLACSILRKGRARMCLARGILYKGAGRSCHGQLRQPKRNAFDCSPAYSKCGKHRERNRC